MTSDTAPDPAPARPDGRRARGAESRRVLIEAALAVLERDGTGGVTHRAVGAQAGMAATSVSYHFGTIDELFVSAITAAAEQWSASLSASSPGTFAHDLATFLVAEARERRPRVVAELELYLVAARRPALRAASRAWAEAVIAPLGSVDEVARRILLAVVDGLCVQLLLADEPLDVPTVEAVLDGAVRLAVPAG